MLVMRVDISLKIPISQLVMLCGRFVDCFFLSSFFTIVVNCFGKRDTVENCKLFILNNVLLHVYIILLFLKDELFTALLEALADCKNFKVRISAAVALASLSDRSKYGDVDMFIKVWVETLKALEKSEELTDFTEFKHKENLQEQVIKFFKI